MIKDKIRKNPYAYFFFKLFVLALFVFALDFSIGGILRHYYFKQQSGLLYRTTYAFENTNEDILIFGSSRANHHYISEVFEKKLGESCYNAGRDGEFIFYDYAILRSVLKRYTPKMVILDFNVSDLRKDSLGYDMLSSLLPYYQGHPELRSIAELKGPFEKWKLTSAIYPYNSTIFTIAVGNTESNKKRSADIKGYVPLYEEWNRPVVKDSRPLDCHIDSVKLNYYESFIKDCVEKNIELYIVKSPAFHKSPYADPYVTTAKAIAAHYHVDFLDYSQDSVFINNNGKIFSDAAHLNDKGARLFSGMLTDSMLAIKAARLQVKSNELSAVRK